MNFLSEFLFPKKCVICGRSGKMICDQCFSDLRIVEGKCPMCSGRSLQGWTHNRCRKKQGMEGLSAMWSYRDPRVKKIIKGIKYRRYKDLIKEIMERVDGNIEADFIVPIPLYWQRLNDRGFNQAEEIARYLDKQKLVDILVRKKKTKPLAEMRTKEERSEEIKGVFELKKEAKRIVGKKILLVDDVYTSGATMREAAKVLKRNGAREVWGWVLAS